MEKLKYDKICEKNTQASQKELTDFQHMLCKE